ncbi:Teneurin-4 [Dissostichus eleginoides]|uniref:Teneurin-4 n=1 Tax=Dissostichus eleginoides TaxID=100907 RepID=A0AAD9CEI9_DISEL|nr:Teneurin-4 [Dissostichus eleginoides]
MVLGRLPVGARCHAETQDLRPCNLPTFSNGAAGPAERTSFREPGENGAFQNHSRLRTPPLPLSHSHSPNHQHHAASINSLNRGNYTPRSNPSPAPTDSSAPPEGPASGQDCTQDNWLLNSNIPLETRSQNTLMFIREEQDACREGQGSYKTRNIAKQTFLETLQDNLIEMDILASARRDASYNDGHFLFKPGGTSPMYCTTSPGYPLTSSTVYSPPLGPCLGTPSLDLPSA